MHEWLMFSLILLRIWFAIFLFRPFVRKEMFWVSLFTMPSGLTEPLFVPEYWNPPSLFDLAARTGFDIESLIFSFAVGGVAAALYEAIFNIEHRRMNKRETYRKRHLLHRLAIISPIIVFLFFFLYFFFFYIIFFFFFFFCFFVCFFFFFFFFFLGVKKKKYFFFA